MNSLNKAYAKMRSKNKRSYSLLFTCNFISVLLITAFAVVMQSNTVQTILPQGGDSRKQMVMIFVLAVAGCTVFTVYASSLFFRSKSREIGVLMAMGAKRGQLAKMLYSDLGAVSAASAGLGILLGAPLAIGVWQLFRLLIVNSEEMRFSLNLTAFLWPLAFVVLTTFLLLFNGRRFIKRSNIIDIVNEQRKSEPVKEVKRSSAILGAVFMVGGAALAVILPEVLASMGYTPPFWISLFYLLAAAGLYLVLVYAVVHGFGGRKSYYKNIITRSMMKFQGRQTVLNMCVITALVIAAYFAMFYPPNQYATQKAMLDARTTDFAFHSRADESGVPGRAEIEQMANEENVQLTDFVTASFANLAADGFDREWTDDGKFGNEYYEFFAEEQVWSESAFNAVSGMNVSVKDGGYIYVTNVGYSHSPYDYIEDMGVLTNPTTMQTLNVSFQEEVRYNLLHETMVISDADYSTITSGLAEEWQENWVQFNTTDSAAAYPFAKRLKDAIIDGSGENSAVFENYDRIEKINANNAGQEYAGDTNPDRQVDYSQRESSKFNQYWRYIPMFRIIDENDFIINMAVYIMLFVFMAIICLSAVIVIAYTRCLTIAVNNSGVYEDLRRLGAKRGYLYRSVKGQVSKVFFVPAAIGTVLIYGYISLVFYSSGGFSAGEKTALGINALLVLATSILLWAVYRLTLKKVSGMVLPKEKV